MKTRIGVIGCDGDIPQNIQKISERIGGDIGRSGSLLICGGRGGVMEAACSGAKKAGGITVGILPSSDKKDANPYVDVPITTGMGLARNALVVSCSDVIIAINGRSGTLSEIGLALSYRKPVIVVKGSGGLADSIEEKLNEMGIKEKLHTAEADRAVQLALRLVS
ncbi:MAG: TIGR00725 family protein [Candidatus Altiarchaeota archaeon]|nr:TIGR00725 family protein [Candidatus Altiarchaeota archaeon]